MRFELTPKQQHFLEYIQDEISRAGKAPSLRRAARVMGVSHAAVGQMLKTLDGGRLSIGAMGLGGAQGAYELALKYAKNREQFGQPISKFQAVAFKLADSAMEIECARNLLYKACWLRDKKRPFER